MATKIEEEVMKKIMANKKRSSEAHLIFLCGKRPPVEIYIEPGARARTLLGTLASWLDEPIGSMRFLHERECMEHMSSLIRTVIRGDETDPEEMSFALRHTMKHVHEAEDEVMTWQQFWDRLAWRAFSALLVLAREIQLWNQEECMSNERQTLVAKSVTVLLSIKAMFHRAKGREQECHLNYDTSDELPEEEELDRMFAGKRTFQIMMDMTLDLQSKL